VVQDVAGDCSDTRYRSEHGVWLVVDGFLVEVYNATGIRKIIRHKQGMVASFNTEPSAAGANTSTC
jgi:hypothetical protein